MRKEYFIKISQVAFLPSPLASASLRWARRNQPSGPFVACKQNFHFHLAHNISISSYVGGRQWYLTAILRMFSVGDMWYRVYVACFESDIWFWWIFRQQVDLYVCIWKECFSVKSREMPITTPVGYCPAHLQELTNKRTKKQKSKNTSKLKKPTNRSR